MKKTDRIDEVLKELEYGFIPYEFMYTLEKHYKIDWTALVYNEWDHVDYWCAKQPAGLLEQFPVLFSFVENIAKQKKGMTPLMELEERKNSLDKV